MEANFLPMNIQNRVANGAGLVGQATQQAQNNARSIMKPQSADEDEVPDNETLRMKTNDALNYMKQTKSPLDRGSILNILA